MSDYDDRPRAARPRYQAAEDSRPPPVAQSPPRKAARDPRDFDPLADEVVPLKPRTRRTYDDDVSPDPPRSSRKDRDRDRERDRERADPRDVDPRDLDSAKPKAKPAAKQYYDLDGDDEDPNFAPKPRREPRPEDLVDDDRAYRKSKQQPRRDDPDMNEGRRRERDRGKYDDDDGYAPAPRRRREEPDPRPRRTKRYDEPEDAEPPPRRRRENDREDRGYKSDGGRRRRYDDDYEEPPPRRSDRDLDRRRRDRDRHDDYDDRDRDRDRYREGYGPPRRARTTRDRYDDDRDRGYRSYDDRPRRRDPSRDRGDRYRDDRRGGSSKKKKGAFAPENVDRYVEFGKKHYKDVAPIVSMLAKTYMDKK